jgi:hypothetical protein
VRRCVGWTECDRGEIGSGIPTSFFLHAKDRATVEISGGNLLEVLRAEGESQVTIFGTNFAVDGVPVDFGLLPPTTGQLTGTLADGATIDVQFQQFTGPVITLAEPVSLPAASATFLGLLAILVAASGLATIRRTGRATRGSADG